MSGKRSKLLRKQAGYKKTRLIKVVGDYNIKIGSGTTFRILNVPKTEVQEPSDVETNGKKLYKNLKREYKPV